MTEPPSSLHPPPHTGVPVLTPGPQPMLATDTFEVDGATMAAEELSFRSGLELVARSQWWYARHRFLRHRLAMMSLLVLAVVFVLGGIAHEIAPYGRDSIDFTA